MNETTLPLAIRRILVAIDASPDSLAALEVTVRLAAKMNAELQGLFVEDQALLRLAEIPLVRELPYFSTEGVPLSRESVELKFRAQAEQVRATLALAAERSRVTCSFRSVRGHVGVALSSAAGEVDLVVLGETGRTGSRSLLGSTALQIISGSAHVLLLPKRGFSEPVHLVVFFDGSKAAERGIRAARELAGAGLDGITILAPSDTSLPFDLRKAAAAEEANLQIRFRSFDRSSEKSLLQALEAERGGVLILGGGELLPKVPRLEAILFELQMPLLLLGAEPANREP